VYGSKPAGKPSGQSSKPCKGLLLQHHATTCTPLLHARAVAMLLCGVQKQGAIRSLAVMIDADGNTLSA
jgi:hypothetical protein